MCSRFALSSPPRRLIDRFGLTVPPPLPDAGVLRPTDMALVILPGRVPALRMWGLAVDWSARPVINARVETLREKPTFRPLLGRRVIVPADTYTEWRSVGDTKVPHHIGRADGDIMALAGLADGDGRFVLLTCAPAPSVAHIHDRMPVVLRDAGTEAAWLDADMPFDAMAEGLRPYPHPLRVEEERPRQGDLFG